MRKEIWTETASFEYDQNIDYVLKKWSEKEALRFIAKVASILSDKKNGTIEYPLTEKGDVRNVLLRSKSLYFIK